MSIPKIVHYCWISGDDKPHKIKECIESWQRVLPDYEVKCWDMHSYDFDSIPFLKDAVAKKRWAFIADFIRIYAVYKFGGIYLDSDVMVFKSLDTFLDNDLFIGTEDPFANETTPTYYTAPEAGIFGAKKGHVLLQDILEYYNNLHESITEDVLARILKLDTNSRAIFNDKNEFQLVIAPIVFSYFLHKYGYSNKNIEQYLKCGIHIYPYPYFVNGKNPVTPETFAHHININTWVNPKLLPAGHE